MRVEHIILAGDAAAVYSTLGRCESYTLGTGSTYPEITAPSAIHEAERRTVTRIKPSTMSGPNRAAKLK